ncbi:MAG TPA: multicopper oxidase domain-containing protein [Nitrospiraceae bacterium]|nr:multicopper oxidase domain-containing protein [Nitrospiraceae bacterium]
MSLLCFSLVLVVMMAVAASAQSFQVQCPTSTITHPNAANNNSEPDYTGPTTFAPGAKGYLEPSNVNGAIKCQQISGGDGFATMGDGSSTYLFAFGPLSGLKDMAEGKPGTQFPSVFNTPTTGLQPGDPAFSNGIVAGAWPGFPLSTSALDYNGAVGLAPDADAIAAGLCTAPCIDGHVDTRQIMDVGVMNGNMPAPLMAIDEDDEFFLTLTNVGQVMRPDLFEQHTVHFHGYPNASAFYDGVPDASVAINIGGSFTYYYLAPDAGTYFWHCHITPPEHLQMGMVGQIYVRPRQNRVQTGADLGMALKAQQGDKRTKCDSSDILCSNPMPAGANAGSGATGVAQVSGGTYAYNDGDGSTRYDVEYPLQIHGFDPNFHFVGMTFNPEGFTDMKDKYFLLNGRSYPDTVTPGPLATQTTDGVMHFSQPLPSIINIPVGGKALLRIADLDVTEYQTLASLGIPMTVVGYNAKLLRDQAGNNLYYKTNSITLAGGESLDVILDASDTTKFPANRVFYLYTPNLDHLSNDAENFGGLMTEVHICSSVTGGNTFGNQCVN